MVSTACGRRGCGNPFVTCASLRSPSGRLGVYMRTRSLSRRRSGLLLALLVSAPLLLSACDDGDDAGTDDSGPDVMTTATPLASVAATEATPTVDSTGAATATATATVTAPEVIEREGISFVSPEGWLGAGDTWTSPDGAVTLLFASAEREAGSEPEAVMLPQGAVNLDRTEVDTPLGPGAIHTVELKEPTGAEVYERHALVRTDDRIYDWWLAARTIEDLDAHQAVLEKVLTSTQREDAE